MPFAGLDLHKRFVEAAIIDDLGQLLLTTNFPATRQALLAFARRHLTLQHHVAVEATANTWPVVALLEPFAARVIASNPLRTRVIAEAKIKTDKVDALTLAQLLRLDYLPTVWTPDAETRQLRHATTERAALVADRTRIKNRIHSILHQRLIPLPDGDLFSNKNLAWLASLPLDPRDRESLERQLRLLALVQQELAQLEDELAQQAHADPQTKLLMTLPGVDFTVAQAILAALGDIDRFPSADQAAAYLGLVPSTRQSADHCYHGPITKQGRSHSRWLLVQAAQHIDRHPGPLGVFFRRIARKKNRNVAVVATAHKLVLIAWHMLRNNEPYRYANPSTMQAKFARLRIQAGGTKKRGGTPKGKGRPANYGSGQPTRAVPALDSVYAAEALPPLQPLRPGEQKMLDHSEAGAYAAHIRQSKRVPRAKW